MASRVATDADVVEAARRVLRATLNVVSQRELRRLVLLELRQENPEAMLGAERLRRLLAQAPFVRVDLRARRGPRSKVMTKCPVCGTPLHRQKNQTLFGGEVTLTLHCRRCGYWTGKEKRIPALYTFHYVGADGGQSNPSGLDKGF